MKRSMYSVILMDDVIVAIDQMAQQHGTSRSNYINQVLAQHAGFVTPEQQMRQVFSCMIEQMDSAFRVQHQGSDAMLSIFGALQYKYRPTVRYSVELLRDQRQQEAGLLKISCRTQSSTLLQAMQSFYQFWIHLEQQLNPDMADFTSIYEIDGGKLTRVLLRTEQIKDDAQFGAAIGNYIRMFHAVLQSYFTGLQKDLSAPILQHVLEQQYLALRSSLKPNL